MKTKFKYIWMPVMFILLAMTACEYDGPTAAYYQDQNVSVVSPAVTAIAPATIATPGVYTLTITGTDFSANMDEMAVYVNGVKPDILTLSTTSMTIRRPAITGDSLFLKVLKEGALNVASFGPYEITPVHEAFGGFIENLRLGAVAADKDGNVYIAQNSPREIYKITPSGEKTMVAELSRAATDIKIMPNGNIIALMNNTMIMEINPTTGEETDYMKTAGRATCGDYDANHNFYVAGNKIDISIIHADGTMSKNSVLKQFTVNSLRVFQDYVYVVAEAKSPSETIPEFAVWRLAITDAVGTLGEMELVLDWSLTGDFAESVPSWIEFADDGTMLIGCDNENPVFILNTDGSQDVLYKGILPTAASKLVWGSGTDLYMIISGDVEDIIKIEMAGTSAPYYGR